MDFIIIAFGDEAVLAELGTEISDEINQLKDYFISDIISMSTIFICWYWVNKAYLLKLRFL